MEIRPTGRLIRSAGIAFAALICAASPVPAQQSPGADRQGLARIENVSLDQALRLAESWIESDRSELADQLLEQLQDRWPSDPRIALLRGLAARDQGDLRSALGHFRRATDLAPSGARARYELARAYADLRRWDQAQFHYRFVLGSDAPESVKRDVTARIAKAAEDRRWRIAFELALAPNSNVNVAPEDATIDPVLNSPNPVVLTPGSTARSGVGLHAAASVLREIPLIQWDSPDQRWRARLGASAAATDYEGRDFDDEAIVVTAGLSLRRRGAEYMGDIAQMRRWYGGRAYEDATTMTVRRVGQLNSRTTLRTGLSLTLRDNQRRDSYDGWLMRAGAQVRKALASTTYAALELSGSRFDAAARSTSYWQASASAEIYRDFLHGLSVKLRPSVTYRAYDGPDPLFQKTRDDIRWSVAASVIKRDMAVAGLAPFVRYRYTDSASSLRLHRFSQHSAEFGVTSIF